MISKTRVRFAPSPTGPLHIGGLRTALYNYLFAKKNNGTFILRIEDTDQARYVEGAEKYIIESLKWCGIEIDEGVSMGGEYGPYRQSERKDMYGQYIDELIGLGKAYYAFDTPEELDMQRKAFEEKGESFMYNSLIRNKLKNSLTLSDEEVMQLINSGVNYVVRFKTPENEEVRMKDMIRGEVVVNTGTLDDKVLLKADGMPTYHLANIVDDHLMEISHVIRGEEWLPSLPLHVLLYRAFGWEEPQFAHMSLLLRPTGKGKLSKRDGDKLGFSVFPLYWPYGDTARGYREDGYFPDAFVNMLALLGWSSGTDQEIFSMDELIREFNIEKIGKSGIRFDPEKAKWFNHQYMQMKPVEDITAEFVKLLDSKGYQADNEKVNDLVKMVRERTSFINELWDQTDYFFEAPQAYEEKFKKKRWKESTPGIMRALRTVLAEIDDFSAENTETKVKAWIEKNEYGMGAVMNAFRLLIVGAGRGPHLFDIIAWIGKDETLARIDKGLKVLSK